MTPFTKSLLAGMLASTLAACSSPDDAPVGTPPIDDQPGTTTASTDGGTGTTGGDGTTGDTGTTGGDGTTGGTGTTGGDGTTGGTGTTGGDGTTGGTGTTGGDGTTGGTGTTGGDGTTGGTGTTGGDGTTGGTGTTGGDGTTGGTGTTDGDTTHHRRHRHDGRRRHHRRTGTTGGDGTTGGTGTTGGDGQFGEFNRTESEALSVEVNGPSRFDGSRTDEAPSAPTNLTALLVAENWIEIDWAPSSDDGAVVAYKIYRDGNLVHTLDDEPGGSDPTIEQRNLRTTTYIDCNYTKNSECVTVGQPGPGGSHVYQVSAIDSQGNESALSAPATFELNTIDPNGSPPDLVAEGYVETFFDDFDTDSLDADDNWVTDLSFAQFRADGGAINGAQQYFVDVRGQDRGFPFDPFVFENGNLKITAIDTPANLLEESGGQPYLSGAISTRSKVPGFEYGYFEMRAKVPSGNGLLSTFFLFQPSGNQYEIDILEYLGREPDGATQNYHYRDGFRFEDTGFAGVPHASPTMFLNTGEDLSQDFHTYSVLWEPGIIIFYIDEREVRRLTGPRVSDRPMDIVLQLVVGTPNFAGDPTGTPFPVEYEVDYVRVLQKP